MLHKFEQRESTGKKSGNRKKKAKISALSKNPRAAYGDQPGTTFKRIEASCVVFSELLLARTIQ